MTIEYSVNKVDKVAFLKKYPSSPSTINFTSKIEINPEINLIKFNFELEKDTKIKELNETYKVIKSENNNSISSLSPSTTSENTNTSLEITNELNDENKISTRIPISEEEYKHKINIIKKELENKRSEIELENSKIIETKLNEVIENIKNIDISQFEQNIDVIINAENLIFSDIEFTVDKSKVKLNSQSIKQNIMSGATLGSSNMLDAINEQKFAVILGRKTANLRNLQNQNHDCIDALIQNGLMGSPKVMNEYSIGKILIELSKLKLQHHILNFYIVHSALQVNNLEYNGISQYNVPRYTVGEGEILSVFFRYIAILFFPYLTISNVSNIDYKYDL